jgi:sortase A
MAVGETGEKRVTDKFEGADTDLLQAGIAAIKARQLSRARSLLMRAVTENENDARAWLCLSRVLHNPAAQKTCLERALALDPSLPAHNLLSSTCQRLAAQLTKEGIAAARAGKRKRARTLLQKAVREDSENPTAWLWLSKTASTSRDRVACRQKANKLKAGLRASLRASTRTRPAGGGTQTREAWAPRHRLAIWLSIACVAIGATLIIGLVLSVARNTMAGPSQVEVVAEQDKANASSLVSSVGEAGQPTRLAAVLATETPVPEAAPKDAVTATPPSPAAAKAPTEARPAQPYTPTRIVVPSVGVDGPVIPIALNTETSDDAQARWEVPEPHVAGWHKTSAPLGIAGNTVINGHNWPQEAIFRNLYQLQPGEAVIVYADELGFVYKATEVVLLPEQDQPWEIQIANTHYIDPSDDDRLTLVTCHPYGSVRYRLVVVALRTELGQPDG